MTYKKVQFIAYCIHTGPKEISSTKKQYLGIAPASADIAERIKLVRKAIELARTDSSTKQSDAETLKIFMMPEFFFRGKEGAYALDLIFGVQPKSKSIYEWVTGGFLSNLSRLTGLSQPGEPRVEEIGLIGLLQNLVKDQQWKNWIFVFGSIIGSSVQEAGISGKVSGEEEVYNLVLVQKGGFGDTPGAGPTFAKVVMKEYISPLDFIKTSESGGGAVLERVFHPLTANQQQLVKHLRELLKLEEGKLRAAPISFTDKDIFFWKRVDKKILAKALDPQKSPEFLQKFLSDLRSNSYIYLRMRVEKFLKAELGDAKAQELLLISPRSEEQQKEYDGSSVFEIDGIRFGLEVCLDHDEGRLKNSKENSKNLLSIDIQLVPSCGSQINDNAIAVKTNGYIFNCDGYADYTVPKLGYNSQVKQRKDPLSYQEIPRDKRKDIIATDIRIDDIYPLGAGEIRIYPAQTLATGAASTTASLFPNNAGFALSLADTPILLNGMKVIFDQPVGVYPVTLESKEEK